MTAYAGRRPSPAALLAQIFTSTLSWLEFFRFAIEKSNLKQTRYRNKADQLRLPIEQQKGNCAAKVEGLEANSESGVLLMY
jgi:hypothetical protein